MPATTPRNAKAADVAALVLRDSLHRDTPNVRAMFRRATHAIQEADGAALGRELTGDVLAWNDGHRVNGRVSVTALVLGHRELVPGQQVDFGEPQVAFVGAEAWARIPWAWSVSAGEAICRLARQGAEWRIAAIDPTGERLAAPDEDFDPRAAAQELDRIAAIVALLGASLRAAGARAFTSDSGGGLPILDAEGSRLPTEAAEKCLDELANHLDATQASVAACLPSGRALVTVNGGGSEFTLHIERTCQWRLVTVVCGNRHANA
jgi:hypothetical protein